MPGWALGNKMWAQIKAKWGLIELILLGAIVLWGGCLRFGDLAYPNEYYFDEVYHVPTIKMIAAGDERAYQWWHGELIAEGEGAYVEWLHPPLAKLAAGVSVNLGQMVEGAGVTSWWWRAPSAVAGVITIIIVYGLARGLFPQQKGAGLIAAFLLAADGLAIAQSQIGMNDMINGMFVSGGLLSYYYYTQTKKWQLIVLTGLFSGLACASKWSGAVLGLFIIVYELFSYLQRKRQFGEMGKNFLIVGLLSGVIYLVSYGQMLSKQDWSHFVELHRQILLYQTGLEAEHPYSSPGWSWPLALTPVYLYLDAETGEQIWNRPIYPLWYLGAATMIVVMGVAGRKLVWRKQKINGESCIFLSIAFLCFWLPWCFSPRIMFFHHYLPASLLAWVAAGGVISWLGQLVWKKYGDKG